MGLGCGFAIQLTLTLILIQLVRLRALQLVARRVRVQRHGHLERLPRGFEYGLHLGWVGVGGIYSGGWRRWGSTGGDSGAGSTVDSP